MRNYQLLSLCSTSCLALRVTQKIILSLPLKRSLFLRTTIFNNKNNKMLLSLEYRIMVGLTFIQWGLIQASSQKAREEKKVVLNSGDGLLWTLGLSMWNHEWSHVHFFFLACFVLCDQILKAAVWRSLRPMLYFLVWSVMWLIKWCSQSLEKWCGALHSSSWYHCPQSQRLLWIWTDAFLWSWVMSLLSNAFLTLSLWRIRMYFL